MDEGAQQQPTDGPDLGPFRPPSTLEPEFHAPTPRPIPESLRQGRYAQTRRTTLFFFSFFALSAFAAWTLTRSTTLDPYFLALPYFHWVAAASAATAGVLALLWALRPGQYAYVRDGVPLPCRVLDLRLAVASTHDGSPNAYRYSCSVQFQRPGASELEQALLQSPEFSVMFKDATYTTLRVGDYVTAVALPEDFDKTLTLYGFLQLSPEVDFIRRKGREPGTESPARDALLFVGVVYLLLGLLTAIVCVPSLVPIGLPESADPRWAGPLSVLVAVAGTLLARSWLERSESKGREELEARNAAARQEGRPVEEFSPLVTGRLNRSLLILGGGFVPLLILTLALSSVNALLDKSAPAYEQVAIKDFRQRTWLGIFRAYEVRYTPSGGSWETINVPVTRLALFQELSPERGLLERKKGRLGMPWVKDIHPFIRGEDGITRVLLPPR